MKNIKLLIPLFAVIGVVVYASAFTVNQWEVALKLRLGEIVHSTYEPGLHWMMPVINLPAAMRR